MDADGRCYFLPNNVHVYYFMRTLINPLHFCVGLPILQVGKPSFREGTSLPEDEGAHR